MVRKNEITFTPAISPNQLALIKDAFEAYVKCRTSEIKIIKREYELFSKCLDQAQRKRKK